MARGYNILPGPEEGPVLDFMYGPVSAAAYVPAGWSPTPSGAIWAGIAMSFVFVVGPFAWLAFARAHARMIACLAVVCLGVLCFYDATLYMVASSLHADAPSIGLAACACASLLSGRERPSNRRMLASAIFAVLAVWAKQTAVPIVIALPAYVWLRDGRRIALRFTLIMGAVGVSISALFVLWFGIDGIFFTMFQIPAGHPWMSVDGRAAALIASLERLVKASLFSGALVLAVAVASLRHASTPLRSWLQEQPWVGLAFVGLVMVPVSALGGAKLGGSANSYALTTYFLMSAGVLGLAQLAQLSQLGRSPTDTAARLALAGIVIFALADELRGERQEGFERALIELREWRSNPVERATAFALRHPHQVLFVKNPLIGLYSDGLLYNSTIGIGDRLLAGFKVSPALRHRHLPAKLRYVGVRRKGVLWRNARRRSRPALDYPTFTEQYQATDLPDHWIWTSRLFDE
jgi:hypothetical protein